MTPKSIPESAPDARAVLLARHVSSRQRYQQDAVSVSTTVRWCERNAPVGGPRALEGQDYTDAGGVALRSLRAEWQHAAHAVALREVVEELKMIDVDVVRHASHGAVADRFNDLLQRYWLTRMSILAGQRRLSDWEAVQLEIEIEEAIEAMT